MACRPRELATSTGLLSKTYLGQISHKKHTLFKDEDLRHETPKQRFQSAFLAVHSPYSKNIEKITSDKPKKKEVKLKPSLFNKKANRKIKNAFKHILLLFSALQ